MGEEPAKKCKLVLVGDQWPAKEQLSENLQIPDVDPDQPLESQKDAILEKLGISDMKDLEIFKGKGKPPVLYPGKKVQLKHTPKDVGVRGPLCALYFRRHPLTLMLVGAEFPPAEKASQNISVKVRRNEKIGAKESSLLSALSEKFEGEVCLGDLEFFLSSDGKNPEGEPVDFSKTPDELELTKKNVFLFVVRKEGEQDQVAQVMTEDEERAKAEEHLTKRVVQLEDGPLGLDFRASCGRVFVIKVAEGSPMEKGGVPKHCCIHKMDGEPVTTKDEVVKAVTACRAAGKTEMELMTDERPQAPYYYGARVDCKLLYDDGSHEWAPGWIHTAYHGDFYDVQLLDEDEIERYVPIDDLKPTENSAGAPDEPPKPKEVVAGAPDKTPPKREPEMEGNMQKKGETGGYKQRRFVLFAGKDEQPPALYYYAPGAAKPQGVLDLRDAIFEDRHATGEKKGKSKFSIAGKHIKRIVLLDAFTEDDKLAWFSALDKVGVQKTAASKEGEK